MSSLILLIVTHYSINSFFLSMLGDDNQLFEEDLYSDDDNEEVSASIFEGQPVASPEPQLSSPATHRPFLHFTSWVCLKKKKCCQFWSDKSCYIWAIRYNSIVTWASWISITKTFERVNDDHDKGAQTLQKKRDVKSVCFMLKNIM